jgi:hypothetical protein
MRRLIAGCLLAAFAAAVLQGALAFGQEGQAEGAAIPPVGQAQADLTRFEAAMGVPAGFMGDVSAFIDLLVAEREQYRALMISELHFCRTACRLTEEQGTRIAQRAGALIDQAATRAARSDEQAAKRDGKRLATDPAPPNAVKVVRDGLFKFVSEHATPAQRGRYQAELTKRAAHAKQTAISALVARLDRELILTTAQRNGLLQVLDKNWNDDWGAMTGFFGEDAVPFPAIPDRLIVPLLSSTQQRIWKRLDKQAIDAADAYTSCVSEIMDGLPSDFAAGLDAVVRAAGKPPAANPGPAVKQVDSKEGAR